MSGTIQPSSHCRWGILGAAGIARKNWQGIFHANNATLIALASRQQPKAQQFIDQCQAEMAFTTPPIAVEGYDALLHRDDIDAVYIPLPTGIRKQWVLKAAQAGKHVLCEKPCASSVADLTEMISVCEQHGVQFMDGVMFMHNSRLDAMRKRLNESNAVGDVKRISSQFSFPGSEQFFSNDIRVKSNLEPLGCLGDLGWYNIRFILWLLNYSMPDKVSGRILVADNDKAAGLPWAFSGELFFANDVSASFYCSFLVERQQWVNVSGTKGYLHVDDFVSPRNSAKATFTLNDIVYDQHGNQLDDERKISRQEEVVRESANDQITEMICHFSALVASGQPEKKWSDIALQTQQVVNACLHSAQMDSRLVRVA